MRAFIGIGALVLMGMAFVGGTRQEPESTVADYVTSLRGRSENQRHNAHLCAKKLDGTIIQPGQVFSFNQVVGPWSRDRGYRRAPVSYGGQLVDAWGGGVCQISTTIYNAALLAGFQVIERSPHFFSPSYIDPGRDAAVGYPNIDLKFKNTLGVPVRLEVSTERDQIRARFVARGLAKSTVTVWTSKLRETDPQTIRLSRETRTWVRNPGRAGYSVQTWRSIEGQKELVSFDNYPVMNRVIDGESYR